MDPYHLQYNNGYKNPVPPPEYKPQMNQMTTAGTGNVVYPSGVPPPNLSYGSGYGGPYYNHSTLNSGFNNYPPNQFNTPPPPPPPSHTMPPMNGYVSQQQQSGNYPNMYNIPHPPWPQNQQKYPAKNISVETGRTEPELESPSKQPIIPPPEPTASKAPKRKSPDTQTELAKEALVDEEVKKPVKKPVILVGKRRGGRVLPTGNLGVAKKPRAEVEKGRSDAWSRYMAEVQQYKDRSCEEDRKNRPLVK